MPVARSCSACWSRSGSQFFIMQFGHLQAGKAYCFMNGFHIFHLRKKFQIVFRFALLEMSLCCTSFSDDRDHLL